MKVTDITRAHIKNFLHGKINEGYSKSTANNLRAIISDTLNEAVDAEVILANPSHRLGKIGKKENAKVDINPLTRDEVKKLLATVQMDRELSSHYPLFLLLARTGLRTGEGIALKWDDIDFNGGFIHVERTFSKGRVGTPKNGRSLTVDMSNQLKDTLLRLKQDNVVVSINKGNEWVFTDTKGGLIDTDNWRRRIFKKALKRRVLEI